MECVDTAMAGEGQAEDVRITLLQQYCLGALKQKVDKWTKMMSQEENVATLTEFLEKADVRTLVVSVASSGQLTLLKSFPSNIKNKAVYFIKKEPEALAKQKTADHLLVGDISLIPLEQLSSYVESVSFGVICNTNNNSNVHNNKRYIKLDIYIFYDHIF